MKFSDDAGRLVLSNARFRLSVSRFLQKIFAIKSRSRRKTEKIQMFCGPQFLWEGRLRLLYCSLLGPLTSHYLAKFGWVPFADVHLRSLACRMQNLPRVGKMQVEFEAVCGPKFMKFWDDVGDLLLLSTHLTDYLYRVSFRRYRPLNCR